MPRGKHKLKLINGPNNKLGSTREGTIANPLLVGDTMAYVPIEPTDDNSEPSPLDILIEREDAALAQSSQLARRKVGKK